MTKSTITREESVQAVFDLKVGYRLGFADLEILKRVARMALAAMDSEPVAWTDEQELRDVDRGGCGYLFTVNPVTPHADERRIILLYRHAQPSIVPDAIPISRDIDAGYLSGWNDCRAAMLQENAKSAGVSNNCRSSENVQVMQDHQIRELVNQLRDIAVKYHAAGQLREQIARVIRAAILQAGNSPVIGIDLASGPDRTVEVRYVAPPGYVMVPKEPTESMVIAGFESEPDEFFSEAEIWEAYQKMSGCEQAAFRARLCWTAMLAAAPQEVKGE